MTIFSGPFWGMGVSGVVPRSLAIYTVVCCWLWTGRWSWGSGSFVGGGKMAAVVGLGTSEVFKTRKD